MGWAERGMVLGMLKVVGKGLEGLLGTEEQEETCLSVVLGEVVPQTDDHHTRMLLCMAMYL